MQKSGFILGMAMGAAAGVGVEMALRTKKARSAVGRTMQAMGTAADSAADAMENIASRMKK